jgi:hypothetical protein
MIDCAAFEETSMAVLLNLMSGDGKKWNLLSTEARDCIAMV